MPPTPGRWVGINEDFGVSVCIDWGREEARDDNDELEGMDECKDKVDDVDEVGEGGKRSVEAKDEFGRVKCLGLKEPNDRGRRMTFW